MRFRTAVLLGVFVLQSLNLTAPGVALAAEPPGALELSELLPDPAAPQTDAADEFTELYNPGSEAVELNGYSLRVGTKTYPLPAQTLPAGEYLVLTSADSSWSLTNDGGVITLLDAAGLELQTTTWPKSASGASWMKDSDNQWTWTDEPTPGEANILAVSAPNPGPAVPSPGTSPAVLGNSSYLSLDITELLPDPAAPQTDAADEFIELYNPNADTVNLAGYVLKTGKTLADQYTLPGLTIGPGEYLALKSAQTHLGLTNAGSSVALFDPAGHQIGAAISYSSAKPGQAWAWSETAWAWTTSATPSSANIIAAPPAAAGAGTKATATKASSKATSTKTSKATSTPKPTTAASNRALLATATSPNTPWLLFVLGALTIGYIIYEFRHDLLSYYHRLRGYPRRSRQTSAAIEEQRGDRTLE